MIKAQVIVVKLGTSVLTGGTDKLDKAHMVELVRQCCELKKQGHQIVIVSSGAVAAGKEQLLKPCGRSLIDKQMLAAIGQGQLIHIWQTLFALYGVNVGQMLLTRADVDDRERYLNARDTLTALLNYDVVPIINENDAVATSEIKVGDNDNLSALVAILANADKLLLLTDGIHLSFASWSYCLVFADYSGIVSIFYAQRIYQQSHCDRFYLLHWWQYFTDLTFPKLRSSP